MDENLPSRPRSHVLGDLAVRAVIRCFPDDWVHRIEAPDYGIDLVSEVVLANKLTGITFAIQVKGKEKTRPDASSVTLRIAASTLNYWLNRPERVMLAIYLRDRDIVVWTWTEAILCPATGKVSIRVALDQQLQSANWPAFVSELEQYYKCSAHTDLERIRAVPSSGLGSPVELFAGDIWKTPGLQDPLDGVCSVDIYSDCSLVKFSEDGYGVVDCGHRAEGEVIRWLRQNEIRRLGFVALSHLHADHFAGLPSITAEMDRIDYLLIPPIGLLGDTVSTSFGKSVGPIARLLHEISRWHEKGTTIIQHGLARQTFVLEPDRGSGAVTLEVLFPARNLQDELVRQLNRKGHRKRGPDHNALCAVFTLAVGQTRFLLPSDASHRAWKDILSVKDVAVQAKGMVLPHREGRTFGVPDILEMLIDSPGFIAVVQPRLFHARADAELIRWVRVHGGLLVSCHRRPTSVCLSSEGVHLE